MLISNLYFQYLSLFYIILLGLIYFLKKRVNNKETKVYSYLVITAFIGVLLDIITTYLAYVNVNNPFLNPLCKLYLVYLLTWMYLLGVYVFYICQKKRLNIGVKLYSVLNIVIAIIVMIIPLYNFSENGIIYTYGPGANLLYSLAGFNVVLYLLLLFINYKNINIKKYYPVFAFIILIIFSSLIQKYNPEVLLVTAASVFVTFLMYFTIENPDLKMIEQLNIARDQAEKANNAKSEFLSNMSHEIRTPLNAIVGFSQALKEEDLPEEAKEEVNDIIMASQNLLELVNGILDISKIEANKLEIVNTEYDINKVLEELVVLTRARLGEKQIEFKTNFDPTIPPVLYGDHTRVKQIILNLLTNAVKYTKEGYINFKVNSVIKGDLCRLIISVEDSGIGIKQENIKKLFTKFERFDLEQNITIEGTGLGLAITKKLIDLMQGKIVVQSEYGKGSNFIVAIDQKIIHTPTIKIKENQNTSEIKPFSVKGKKILVVDDNKLNLKVAERLLRDYEFVIELLDNGFDCIKQIEEGKSYDLILMDDMMPKMTGSETLQKLKEIDDFNIPTIALTANAISGMKEKYLNAGFDDYLSKPIDKLELNRVINEFLNQND